MQAEWPCSHVSRETDAVFPQSCPQLTQTLDQRLQSRAKGIDPAVIESCYRDRSCRMRGMAMVTESNVT